MRIRRLWITIVLVLFITISAGAQDYRAGIGFRGGPSLGFTGKYFFTYKDAGELLLLSRWGGFHLTGLYEKHSDDILIDGLHFYYGGGLHYGSFNGNSSNKRYNDKTRDYSVFGIDGIAGLEYNLRGFPFNVSLDYKPTINFSGGEFLWPDEFALSIRYVWGVR